MGPLSGPKKNSDADADGAPAPLVAFPDQHLFDTLVDRHYTQLYQFALHLCRNPSDAKDVVQETFRRLATHGHQIRNAAAAKTWLYTVAYRSALDQRRWLTRWFQHDEGAADVAPDHLPANTHDVAISADAAAVQEALCKLPERYRAPLSLFYLEELSYEQIAEVLGVPLGTVMSRLHRGRHNLASVLGIQLQTP